MGGVYEHYRHFADRYNVRCPAEKTIYTWSKKYNWKEKAAKHAEETSEIAAKVIQAEDVRKILDARGEVENICELIFDKMKKAIPGLDIKTASDVRQLGLITKDYLEIRRELEGTGADKEAEEVAKTAAQRIKEADERSEKLFGALQEQYIPTHMRPN
jgi:hypothetical protein